MQRPWVTWNGRQFFWSMLSVVAVLVVVRTALLRAVESPAAEIAIHGVSVLVSVVVSYVVFIWASEYDRRNPGS